MCEIKESEIYPSENPIPLEKVKEILKDITLYETDYNKLLNALTEAIEIYPTGVYRLDFNIRDIVEFVAFPRRHSRYSILGISYFAVKEMNRIRIYVEVEPR